jgi:hypothetical protein
MADRQVVVEGSGSNLYRIGESGGRFYVSRVTVGLLFNDYTSIGTTIGLEDALALIRSDSGRNIKSISEW